MSRSDPATYEQAELMFGCAHCGAPAGMWCTYPIAGTHPGEGLNNYARYLHADRWEQVNTVVRLSGWQDMEREALDRVYAIKKAIEQLRNDVHNIDVYTAIERLNQALML